MSTPPRITRLELLPDGWWALNFAHPSRTRFAAIRDELKQVIPPPYRAWDDDERCWLIGSEQHLLRLSRVLPGLPEAVHAAHHRSRMGGTGQGERTGTSTAPAPVDPVRAVYAQLYLLPGAPREVVVAAYRCLAKQWHPDVGGSDEQMRRANLAYEAILAHLAGLESGRHPGTPRPQR
jgi:hypothetical protein